MIRVHRIFGAMERDFSPEALPVQPPIQGVVAPNHLGKIQSAQQPWIQWPMWL